MPLVLLERRTDSYCRKKRESPYCRRGRGGVFIASDAPAIINRTNRFIFLEDNDIAIFKDNTLQLINTDGEKVERKIIQVQWSDANGGKGQYKHLYS